MAYLNLNLEKKIYNTIRILIILEIVVVNTRNFNTF